MRSYSIPEKIVKMVKVMYSGSECAVIDGSDVYDWFEIKTCVKQSCCMSGFLFLLFVDWVMRKTTKHGNTSIKSKFNNFLVGLDFADDLGNTGIRWKLNNFLEDLDFADDLGNTDIRWKFNNCLEDLDFVDDLALISSSGRHIQTKVSNLGRYAKMTGVRINTAKIIMMSWNNPAGRKVQVDGEELETEEQ